MEAPLLQNDKVGWLLHAHYSPDETDIAASWNRPPKPGIYIIPLEGAVPYEQRSRQLSVGAQLPIGWSSDGKQIYAVEYEKGAIIAIPTGKGDPRTIVTLPLPADRTLDYAAISSDGSRVAYVVSESQSDVWMIENFDPEAQ
jgi:Tol biopolymer transport system component